MLKMKSPLTAILATAAVVTLNAATGTTAFVTPPRGHELPVAITYEFSWGLKLASERRGRNGFVPSRMASGENPENEDTNTNEDGANLAADFFKAMKERDISLEEEELGFDDTEEDEPDETGPDDDEEINFPQGAINAFTGIDRGDPGDKLAGETSLTNQQIYDEVKDRVLESAGGFVELTKGVDYEDDGEGNVTPSKGYEPPGRVPDSGMTAGEVVTTVLAALRNCDDPKPDHGIEILFGFSSELSQIAELSEREALTPLEYREFLSSSEENRVLFDHEEVFIDKATYSSDKLRAYYTARLSTVGSPSVLAQFTLSTTGTDDEDCWLIDSMKIRPSNLRKKWRRR